MIAKARERDLLVHPVDDEMVVYDKTRKKAHRLNETAARVWNLLDGERSTSEIAAELGVDESVVMLSVDHLASARLLEASGRLSVSRRDALRRVAGAAAVGFVLPVVTSIAAPFAAQAQSNGNNGKGKGVGGDPPGGSGGNGGGNSPPNPPPGQGSTPPGQTPPPDEGGGEGSTGNGT